VGVLWELRPRSDAAPDQALHLQAGPDNIVRAAVAQ
jgi:hypothetical protein